jgi:hypothetical protein
MSARASAEGCMVLFLACVYSLTMFLRQEPPTRNDALEKEGSPLGTDNLRFFRRI